MILEGYGIQLSRLTIDDIELVRKWRNDASISQFMEFREEISKEQQLEWFRSIDTIYNNYFIVETEGEKVGLIYGAEIDWKDRVTGNGGVFIWDEKYWETKVPLGAAMLLTDSMLLMRLAATYIKVMRDNRPAIAYNKSLGYTVLPNQDEVINQKYILTADEYQKKRMIIRKSIFNLTSEDLNTATFDTESEIDNFMKSQIHTQNEFKIETN